MVEDSMVEDTIDKTADTIDTYDTVI